MADSQRKTANLFDLSAYYSVDSGITDITINGSSLTYNVSGSLRAIRYSFALTPSDVYTVSVGNNSSKVRLELRYTKDGAQVGGSITVDIGGSRTITGSSNYDHFLIYISNGANTGECIADEIMLNEGSTALPYEPYGWVHSLRKLGTATDTLTTLPADLYADGNNATVGLVGNMQQSGTPTPQNPITPSECGERTGNLFDISKVTLNTGITNNGDGTLTVSDYPANASENLGVLCPSLKEGDIVTLKFNTTSTATLVLIRYYDSGGLKWSENWYSGTSKTITAEWLNARVGFYRKSGAQGGGDATISNIMLNTGSQPLPYEPYGYKLDIKSANTTTPVYLGEVVSTRRIKKLVLTGQEDWKIEDSDNFYINDVITDAERTKTVVCSHQVSVQSVYTTGVENTWISSSGRLNFTTTAVSHTATAFKTYLQQQYTAGTPVTVWYVLATETTGIVNEPIRKIGNYADTVSGVTIPTITGKDTVDVETTLKPSEVSLSYTGWHDTTVKEWDSSQWNE